MNKGAKSGPAIFMDWVIALSFIVACACFGIYYCAFLKSSVILWVGITTFTIAYHLWLRILFGNITTYFKKRINYNAWWFKEKQGERVFYDIIRVKEWKAKALTYDPAAFCLKTNTLEQIALNMTKAELDHWINVGISLSTLIFPLIWGQAWIFALTAFFAILFDGQFIVIQRYNRPRVIKLLEKLQRV